MENCLILDRIPSYLLVLLVLLLPVFLANNTGSAQVSCVDADSLCIKVAEAVLVLHEHCDATQCVQEAYVREFRTEWGYVSLFLGASVSVNCLGASKAGSSVVAFCSGECGT